MKEKNEKILMIVIIVCLVALGAYKLFFSKKTDNEKIDTKTIQLVTDNSEFYTVSSAISNYVKYLSVKDNNSVFELLEQNYVNEKSITNDNIFQYTGAVNENSLYIPKKMFVQRISSNVYKYYTFGFLREELLDSIGPKSEFYLILLLDQSNLTYYVIPYDGIMFK